MWVDRDDFEVSDSETIYFALFHKDRGINSVLLAQVFDKKVFSVFVTAFNIVSFVSHLLYLFSENVMKIFMICLHFYSSSSIQSFRIFIEHKNYFKALTSEK